MSAAANTSAAAVDDRGAGAAIRLVVHTDALPGVALDDHLVPVMDGLAHAAGVSPTRFSRTLISFGTPMRMALSVKQGNAKRARGLAAASMAWRLPISCA